MVADIDQLILLLSIPKMQNLARKGMEFECKKAFIKILMGRGEGQNRGKKVRVICTYGTVKDRARISQYILIPWPCPYRTYLGL